MLTNCSGKCSYANQLARNSSPYVMYFDVGYSAQMNNDANLYQGLDSYEIQTTSTLQIRTILVDGETLWIIWGLFICTKLTSYQIYAYNGLQHYRARFQWCCLKRECTLLVGDSTFCHHASDDRCACDVGQWRGKFQNIFGKLQTGQIAVIRWGITTFSHLWYLGRET